MNEKLTNFKNLEELNCYLTLRVIFDLKLALNADTIEMKIYEDWVCLIVKTQAGITKLPTMINSCSSWKIYSEDNTTCISFKFILDE